MYNLILDHLYTEVGEVLEELTILIAGVNRDRLSDLLLSDWNDNLHVGTRTREAIQASTDLQLLGFDEPAWETDLSSTGCPSRVEFKEDGFDFLTVDRVGLEE
jgi:hypothetical protein